MASLLLRNVPRCTSLSKASVEHISSPPSRVFSGNSSKLPTSLRTLLSQSFSSIRPFATGPCFRCHQLVKDPVKLTTNSSKFQWLFSSGRRFLTNSSKRDVSTAAVDSLGGGAGVGVGEAATEAVVGRTSAWTHASGKAIPLRAQKIVGCWLLGCAGACFAQVFLGEKM